MTLQEQREQRKQLQEQARELVAKAKAESREMSTEEDQKFEAIFVDIDKIGKAIEREERLAKVEATFDESERRTRVDQPGEAAERARHGGSEARVTRNDTDANLEGMRSWLMAGHKDQAYTPQMLDVAQRQGIDLDSK
jgi:hypothetical protein